MDKKFFKQLISYSDFPVVMEVGAADGIDTAEFLKEFSDLPGASFYCIEPDKRNLSVFRSTINDPRVKLFEGVIGDVDGVVDFYTSTKNPHTGQEFIYSSSLRRPGKALFETWPMFIDEETCFEPGKVVSWTLDTLCQEQGIHFVDLIYMDVQGCEDLFIRGGQKMLDKSVHFVYTEYNDNEIYVGEPTKDKILGMLPHYSVLADFGTDILLVNNKWE